MTGSDNRNAIVGSVKEKLLPAIRNRILQLIARFGPGYSSLRITLHRWRGVKIGTGVFIGHDVVLETEFPNWVAIGNNVQIGIRSTVIAHMRSQVLPPDPDHFVSIRIEDDVYIGAGVIILPRVTIGRGAVVAAGSVVSRSVPPMTMVQGNPARPVAHCGIPLMGDVSWNEFVCRLRPLDREHSGRGINSAAKNAGEPTPCAVSRES